MIKLADNKQKRLARLDVELVLQLVDHTVAHGGNSFHFLSAQKCRSKLAV